MNEKETKSNPIPSFLTVLRIEFVQCGAKFLDLESPIFAYLYREIWFSKIQPLLKYPVFIIKIPRGKVQKFPLGKGKTFVLSRYPLE